MTPIGAGPSPVMVVASPSLPLAVRTPSPDDDQLILQDPGNGDESAASGSWPRITSKARITSLRLDSTEEPKMTSEALSGKTTPSVSRKAASLSRAVSKLSMFMKSGEQSQELPSMNRGSTNTEEKLMIQAHLKKSLEKTEYDVSMYYWPATKPGYRGRASFLARHGVFERTTLAVIVANAMWQAYDVDHNSEAVLASAPLQFQIAEHFFCAYFSFEWTVRFAAFQYKRNCLKDSWFVFDSMLVSTMVAETWVVTVIMEILAGGSSGGSVLGDSSLLRIARLMRLTRMLRMGRLLRAVPELLIQLKGLGKAMRSVITTLMLLLICLYVFAIFIKQMMDEGTPVQQQHFDSVPKCMYTLLVYAFFMDALGYLFEAFFTGKHWLIAVVFSLCVVFAGLAIQNMLIGVLCEVVSGVGIEERANLKRQEVEEKLNIAVAKMGCKNGTVTKDNFMEIFNNSNDEHSIARLFGDVGVDLIGLLDFSDFIFHDELLGEGEKELTFNEFVDVVMQLRGDKEATVKDMVDLRKYLRSQIRELGTARKAQLNKLLHGISKHRDSMDGKLAKLGEVLERSPPCSVPAALAATASAVAVPGSYAGRLGRVESALAYAKQELHALKADIDLAPLKAEGNGRCSGIT